MRKWTGKSLMVIGVIHSVVGFVEGRGIIGELFREGLFNSVNDQPERQAAFWFLFGGFVIIIMGGCIDWIERRDIEMPPFLKWSFLALIIVGCVMIPASGFWLLLVPAAGLFLMKKR